jgi:hypothetical protein
MIGSITRGDEATPLVMADLLEEKGIADLAGMLRNEKITRQNLHRLCYQAFTDGIHFGYTRGNPANHEMRWQTGDGWVDHRLTFTNMTYRYILKQGFPTEFQGQTHRGSAGTTETDNNVLGITNKIIQLNAKWLRGEQVQPIPLELSKFVLAYRLKISLDAKSKRAYWKERYRQGWRPRRQQAG